MWVSIRSASLFSSRPRSAALILRQGPPSNALRASFTAKSTSTLSASAIWQISSPVAGFVVGKLLPEAASTQRLLMSSFVAVMGTARGGAVVTELICLLQSGTLVVPDGVSIAPGGWRGGCARSLRGELHADAR